MTPKIKLIANGKDVSEFINMNATTVDFKDEAGDVADEITLNIAGIFAKPKYKDELKLWIGTEEKGLFYCGIFTVQSVSSSEGNTYSIEITATAANFSSNLKVKRSVSYENVSIKKIVQIIANRHDLGVASDFDDIYVLHSEQTNESDLNFLLRLADEDNALFAIKNNKIIFKKKIKDNKKSDKLPRFSLKKDEHTEVKIYSSNKEEYGSCKAIWRDTKQNVQRSITVGRGEPIKVIKDSFENVAQAKQKAQATLDKANSGTKTGTITSYGFEVYAGGVLDLFNTLEDDGDYEIKSVHHVIDESGWNFTMEIKN